MQTKNKFFSSFIAVISTAIALLTGINAYAQDSWNKERELAKSLITDEKLFREISTLCDTVCQGRATGTEGSYEAALEISHKFEAAGLEKFGTSWFRQFYISHNLKGRNVIGILHGSKSIPCDRYIVVGAHYDHIGMIDGKLYPGADSNASGVVAMNSLAEMFGKMRKMGKIFGCHIIFVAFDAKEYSFKGSESFWKLLEFESLIDPVSKKGITKDNIVMMMNIDQIGSTLSPLKEGRNDYMIMLGTSSLQKSKRDMLKRCNIYNGFRLDIGLDYYGSANFTKMFYRLSDQRVFVDNKIPSVFFTSGITMNTNKTWDTPETLDMNVLKKRIHLMFHWLEAMIIPE